MDQPDALTIGTFLVTAATLAGIYSKISSMVRQMAGKGDAREITNNPLNVQSQSRPATMDDIKPISDRLDLLEKNQTTNAAAIQTASHENGQKLDDLRDRMDDKLDTLKDTLGELSRAVGRLEGS